MKNTLLLMTATTLIAGAVGQAQADVIASQGFEDGDTYTFTPDPGTYNDEATGDPLEVNGTQDVWAKIKEFTGDIDNPHAGTFFWGGQDLNNPNGGGSFRHYLKFETLDISSYTDVVVSFYYSTDGLDNGDDLYYSIDGGTTEVKFVDGSSNFTTDWVEFTINVDDSATSLTLWLGAIQNGDDFIGFDTITVSGVPEPGSIALLGLGGLLVARRRRG